jgi:hypothetical protein
LQRPASQQMSLAGMNIQNEPSRRTRKRSSGERSATSVRGGKRATKLKSSWNLFQRSKVSGWLSIELFRERARNAERNRLETLRKHSQSQPGMQLRRPRRVISPKSRSSLPKPSHHRRRKKSTESVGR